ncbi:MAG: hypothetical protein AB7I42_25115 [Bradyrhizobium sp.]|uniref:hypothetical protein n=1 Tax=Bradyrhizobium sp. TaxID=376 RepID=UPI003D09BBF6
MATPDTSPFKISRKTRALVLPLPRCDAELSLLASVYFGAPLRLANLDLWGDSAQYEVAQDYSAYHGEGFKYGKHCIVGYDHSRAFWNSVIGPLYCGGIARASYGQARVIGHRNKQRIEYWIQDRRSGRDSSPRPMFVRLARQHGAGESSADRTRPPASVALTGGRVDGAPAASSRGAS